MTESGDDPAFAAARERLVERLRRRARVDERALDALAAVPRHEFVPADRRGAAYADRPLPIGAGQTISAPHMVAIMTSLLDLGPGERVLEVGTGCGYHAAVTAEVVGPEHVHSVEYEPSLAEAARARLDRLGYGDVSVRQGDGSRGWPERAPFDAAYLTCAATDLPSAVVDGVRPGGRLLAPLGRSGWRGQRLVLARKRRDGGLEREQHGRVRFVPMRGE